MIGDKRRRIIFPAIADNRNLYGSSNYKPVTRPSTSKERVHLPQIRTVQPIVKVQRWKVDVRDHKNLSARGVRCIDSGKQSSAPIQDPSLQTAVPFDKRHSRLLDSLKKLITAGKSDSPNSKVDREKMLPLIHMNNTDRCISEIPSGFETPKTLVQPHVIYESAFERSQSKLREMLMLNGERLSGLNQHYGHQALMNGVMRSQTALPREYNSHTDQRTSQRVKTGNKATRSSAIEGFSRIDPEKVKAMLLRDREQQITGISYVRQLRILKARKQQIEAAKRRNIDEQMTTFRDLLTTGVTGSEVKISQQLDQDRMLIAFNKEGRPYIPSSRNDRNVVNITPPSTRRPDIVIPCHTNDTCKFCNLYDDEDHHHKHTHLQRDRNSNAPPNSPCNTPNHLENDPNDSSESIPSSPRENTQLKSFASATAHFLSITTPKNLSSRENSFRSPRSISKLDRRLSISSTDSDSRATLGSSAAVPLYRLSYTKSKGSKPPRLHSSPASGDNRDCNAF